MGQGVGWESPGRWSGRRNRCPLCRLRDALQTLVKLADLLQLHGEVAHEPTDAWHGVGARSAPPGRPTAGHWGGWSASARSVERRNNAGAGQPAHPVAEVPELNDPAIAPVSHGCAGALGGSAGGRHRQ